MKVLPNFKQKVLNFNILLFIELGLDVWRYGSSQAVIISTACCCCWVTSVVSDSVRLHRWQPTRLPHPWDSPGKNTGVGCHFLLQCMKVKSESEIAQLCPTLSDPMDCSLPDSSIHGILQARILEWVAISFSRGSSWPREWTPIIYASCIDRQRHNSLPLAPPGKTHLLCLSVKAKIPLLYS